MYRRAICAALAIGWMPAAALADLIVNPPRPITHRVTVQIIQTALDSGSPLATVFGTPSQRASIEAGIDEIWAQAGIDIEFLPDIVHFDDTFAYQGTAGSNTRPQSDLNSIRNRARSEGGILNSDADVLNMFFVNVVPGFKPLSENSVAGLASIAANGIAAYVGDNLLGYGNGRDVIASVIAHEIGHNMGLFHSADDSENLMNSSISGSRLTASQINTAFSSADFAKLLPVQLEGDFNNDGLVNAADYTAWRNGLGSIYTTADYARWKANFGGSGSSGIAGETVGVPEPACLVAVGSLLIVLGLRRRFIL